MTIGSLRHRIQLQADTLTPDLFGGSIRSWITVATVPAAIEPLSGRELFQAQQLQSAITHKVTIRYFTHPDPALRLSNTFRILFGTRVFQISSIVDPDERNRWMVLMCTEITP